MKRILTWFTVLIFLSSIYFVPALSAITLGDIPSDREPVVKEDTSKKAADSEKKDDKKQDDRSLKKDEKKVPEKDVKRAGEINPRLVCLLSVVMPGGGHFYLGNDTKGIAFCIAAGAGYTVAGFFMIKTMLAERGSIAYRNYLLLTGFVFFITLIVHFVGIIEAYSDAEEQNKKLMFKGSEDPFNSEVIME